MVFNCIVSEDTYCSPETILVSKNNIYCELDNCIYLELNNQQYNSMVFMVTFYMFLDPLILSTSNLNIKSTTGFVGGGSSARTDYKLLKPYVLSTEVQLKNPDEFSYVYGHHCTFDNAMQEIRTSGEPQLVCNIPLALVAHILTSTQAN